MTDERARRLAENEATMRKVNEVIRESAHAFGADVHMYDFLCECSRADCLEMISMNVAEYEAVRRLPERFALRPGHEVPEIEHVTDRNERFVVVEKVGAGRRVAIESDPRR
ncbi:MAG TPA: hypothetical protein VE444_02125 [Gaiellaceae bacterium]|jgi:hypothetical protein|nr:hypothetical protein [Gaiellaceae bacterium]